MMKKIKNYLLDDSGQTSTEYILLIAVAGMLIFRFKGAIEDKLLGDNGVLGRVMNKITSQVDSLD